MCYKAFSIAEVAKIVVLHVEKKIIHIIHVWMMCLVTIIKEERGKFPILKKYILTWQCEVY